MKTCLRAVCLALAAAVPAAAQDGDRDGISDPLEQALLDRFAPTLVLAAGECDTAPASFVPFRSDPIVRAKDGTLYGQAFPVASRNGRATIELHYFHLWSRDCGRFGHDLDVEEVSAIVSASHVDVPASLWMADAWYAAAVESPDVALFQIVQMTATTLRVRLRVAAGADADRVWHDVQSEILRVLKGRNLAHITVERGDEAPEQSAGGKYRTVIPLSARQGDGPVKEGSI
ncbi:MAG: hypothetical protein K2Y23_25595 [Cyanobacteria bacterium]|nr:hypothetical protein [Cyanobacteriota bacterium]